MLLPKMGKPVRGLVNYANIAGILGTLITYKMATLNELQTVYSLEDTYLIYEILTVNSYNERILSSGNRN